MKDLKFKKPESLNIPEGISSSGEFEALATLKVEDDGTLCLKAIDGNRIGDGEDDDKDESSEKDNKTYAEAASSGMMGGMS